MARAVGNLRWQQRYMQRVVLTDDVMTLQLNSSVVNVIPSFPECKLAPESAVALGKNPDDMSPLFAHAYKRAYNFKSGFQSKSLPLKKLYILDSGNKHRIISMHPKDAFTHVVSHTRATKTLSSPQMLKKHFQQCTKLLEQVPCYRFVGKPGLEELPDLVRLSDQSCK